MEAAAEEEAVRNPPRIPTPPPALNSMAAREKRGYRRGLLGDVCLCPKIGNDERRLAGRRRRAAMVVGGNVRENTGALLLLSEAAPDVCCAPPPPPPLWLSPAPMLLRTRLERIGIRGWHGWGGRRSDVEFGPEGGGPPTALPAVSARPPEPSKVLAEEATSKKMESMEAQFSMKF